MRGAAFAGHGSHPAMTFQAMARLRSAPKGGGSHLQVEAVELARVVLDARRALQRRRQGETLRALAALPHHDRLAVVLYATGQALRVPVCVRGGLNDTWGVNAHGNGLARLIAASRGRAEPYSPQTGLRVMDDGHADKALARAPRLVQEAWTDAAGRTWKHRFVRGLLYVPADRLRALYVERAWQPLVAALANALPLAWKKGAQLRRKAGGYWASIRPDPVRPTPRKPPSDAILRAELREGRRFVEIAAKHGYVPFARLRWLWAEIKKSWGIKRSKRSRITREVESVPCGTSRSTPANQPLAPETIPSDARDAAQRAGQGGGRVESPATAPSDAPSTPDGGSFRDRFKAEGLDLGAWENDRAEDRRVLPRLDGGPERRGPEVAAPRRSLQPWRDARYSG